LQAVVVQEAIEQAVVVQEACNFQHLKPLQLRTIM
jgi:hypothetical protein